MIPVSKVVNVSIQASPTFPSAKGFGLLCIFGSSLVLPSGDRIRFYNSLTEVGVDFGVQTEEYLAAQVFFSQAPRPTQLAIARRFSAATPAELLGSTALDTNIAHYTAIANGSLSVNLNGGAVEALTAIDLSGCANLNAVAAAVQTKLAIAVPNSTVTFDGKRFIVRSGTTGVASTITFPSAPGAGTDLSTLMGLNQSQGAKLTQGSNIETVTQTLDAVQSLNGSWYGFTLTKEATEAELKLAAAWSEANVKVFGYTSSALNVLDGADATDIATYMKTQLYSRTIGQWDDTDAYAIVSALARAFTVNFNGVNTTITLKFKQEPGISPVTITETQRLVLQSKNMNYYTYFGDSAMLAEGVVGSGRFFDEVHGLDWLQNAIETAVFGYLFTQTTKIPQTDKGMARILAQVEKACYQAVNNGLLAPGTWNGSDLGDVKSGDFLPKGFYVFADSVLLQSQSARESRVSPPITVLAKGSGAIHHVDITVNFER